MRQKGAFSSFIIRLAIGATALSVATMIVAMAFITGFKYEIREKLFSFWGHIHITPYNVNMGTIITPDPISRNPVLEQKIKGHKEIKEMAPFAVRPAIIQANQVMEGLQLKGVDEQYHLPAGVGFKGKALSYADTAYSKQLLISQTTADRLNINIGDELKLYFLEPGTTFPRIRRMMVSGIYHTGMVEVDRDYAVCDLRLLQRINNWAPDQINGYQITVKNQALADTIARQLYDNYIEPPLSVSTMYDIFPNIFSWLQFQDVNERIILIIMAIVAIMNLAAALLILIVEQSRLIGLLKAQGMANEDMRQIFLYYAALIAGIGIILGNAIALSIAFLQKKFGFITLSESTYYMRYAPVRIYWWQPVLIDVVTLVLCILCMWLPTLYIRRIQPAKVLQFK
ncbi:MAG: ABC transporter permease [Sphingobacteriales bacterium]|nr:MAG: ABC transporter permease [Sphingobacteriales bacterium]